MACEVVAMKSLSLSAGAATVAQNVNVRHQIRVTALRSLDAFRKSTVQFTTSLTIDHSFLIDSFNPSSHVLSSLTYAIMFGGRKSNQKVLYTSHVPDLVQLPSKCPKQNFRKPTVSPMPTSRSSPLPAPRYGFVCEPRSFFETLLIRCSTTRR